ncbi:MAG: SEC-C metal-binding domain-containing protein [Bacillota bacterium]
MLNTLLCPCGSGKTFISCCQNSPNVRVFSAPFANEKERQDFIDNVEIASKFKMPMRGHLLFYGKDLVAYVKDSSSVSDDTYKFLQPFSFFLYQKNDQGKLNAWKDCTFSFWDELISTYFIHSIRLSAQKNEVETLLHELKKFAVWLKKKQKGSFLKKIHSRINTYESDLELCEKVINSLYEKHWGDFHDKDWDYKRAVMESENRLNSYSVTEEGLYEVTGVMGKYTVAKCCETQKYYYFKGLPVKLIQPHLLLSGIIGKHYSQDTWDWISTSAVYPQASKSYLLSCVTDLYTSTLV